MFLGASSGVMVSKLDWKAFTSEFLSHWMLYSYGLVPYQSKKKKKKLKQSKLQLIALVGTSGGVMARKLD